MQDDPALAEMLCTHAALSQLNPSCSLGCLGIMEDGKRRYDSTSHIL